MAQPLEDLVSATNPKQFTAQFKEIEKSYPDIESFLSDLVDKVAPRLYDPFYDEVPNGFYGITCASLAEQLFPFERPWRPYAQQVWALTRQRQRVPGPYLSSPPKSSGGGAREQDLRQAMRQRDFPAVLQISKNLLEESREQLRAWLMIRALEDAVLGGHKLNYLCQSWLLAERLNFVHAEKILFGPLHLLTFSQRDESPADLAASLPSVAGDGEGSLGPAATTEIESTILFGSASETRDRFTQILGEKVRRNEITDLLRLTAARAIANACRGQWLAPVRAFHTAFLTTAHLDWFDEQDRGRALLLAALMVQRASSRTREGLSHRPLDEMVQAFCPTEPFALLKSVVSHSDPFAAATATYSILGMDEEKKQELFQTLMGQAVKNNGDICWGHDLLLVAEAFRCYCHSESESRSLYPVAAAFVLGQVLKDYSLAAEYGV